MKGYKTVTMTTLLYIVLSIHTMEAAPTRHSKNPAAILAQGAKQARGPKKQFWWSNPCAVPGGDERTNPIDEHNKEHIDPDIPMRWLTQLKIAIEHLNRIDKMYTDVKPHFSADSFNHTWLPEQPYHWIEKWKKKQTGLQPVRAMTELYKGLQKFAVTIDCIMRQPGCKVKGQKPVRKNKHKAQQRSLQAEGDFETRMAFFTELKNELRKLLCEVQMLLRYLQKAKLPAPPTPTIIRIEGWVPNPDESQARLQDWGVLSQYIRYLQQWEQIARQIAFRSEPPLKKRKNPKNPNKSREERRKLKNTNQLKKMRHHSKLVNPLLPPA